MTTLFMTLAIIWLLNQLGLFSLLMEERWSVESIKRELEAEARIEAENKASLEALFSEARRRKINN